MPRAVRVPGSAADAALRELFAYQDVDYVFIRHGDAGCHVARADRVAA
jgi:hypothetical protein